MCVCVGGEILLATIEMSKAHLQRPFGAVVLDEIALEGLEGTTLPSKSNPKKKKHTKNK